MDKALRHQMKMQRFKRRLKNLCLKLTDPNSNYNGFRESGKPCSCEFCSPYKYKRAVKHRRQLFEVY